MTHSAGSPGTDLSLEQLQRDFPEFAIWHEPMPDRARYIARARDLSTGLHTVVTADLRELRAALAEAVSPPAS